MKAIPQFSCLLFLVVCSSSIAHAGAYIEISPSLMTIDTPAASHRPVLVDFRLGYEKLQHQFELAVMTSVKDDELNQLEVNVPSTVSVFYHYIPYPQSRLKVHLIVGASRVEVELSIPGIANSTDSFEGISYGIGFEESFQSYPQLKLSLDWIQLYNGDQIDITTVGLGIHYDF